MESQNNPKKGIDSEDKELLAELLKEDGDMVAIKKDEILPGLPLPTDIFVRLETGKFVLIAKRGTQSSLAELHVSQSQNVTNFFIRREDYYVAVEQNLKIAGILARRADIPVPRRAEFLRTAADSVFIEISHLGMTPVALQHARQTVNSVCGLVQNRDDYNQLVAAMSELPGTLIREALAGAALSVLVGRQLGWQNPVNLEKLALGAFLRDVGLKEIPKEILEKPRQAMSADERTLWETHPFRGAEILQKIPEMPSEVISIVLEHHENSIGQGFPRRIRDVKINPMAKVVGLVDLFIHLTIPSAWNANVKSPDSAMHYIEYTIGCPYNKACVVGLKRALGLELATAESENAIVAPGLAARAQAEKDEDEAA